MQSLEELSLLKCLPPDILEKYFLKIVDTLDVNFINVNSAKIVGLVESRSQLFIVVITNQTIGRFTIFRDMNSRDILDIFTYIFDRPQGDTFSYTDTLETMMDCTGGIDTNRSYDKIISDFKNMLADDAGTNLLVGRKFMFKFRGTRGAFVKIYILKTQVDLDIFIMNKSPLKYDIKFTYKKRYEGALKYF